MGGQHTDALLGVQTEGEQAEAAVNPLEKEQLVRRLAAVIDHDEPPGLGAHQLAREVLTLVQDLGGKGAALMLRPIRDLADERRRRNESERRELAGRCGNPSCSKPAMHDDECDFDLAPDDF